MSIEFKASDYPDIIEAEFNAVAKIAMQALESINYDQSKDDQLSDCKISEAPTTLRQTWYDLLPFFRTHKHNCPDYVLETHIMDRKTNKRFTESLAIELARF